MNKRGNRKGLFSMKKLISLQVAVALLLSLIVASAAPFQEWNLGRYQLLTTPPATQPGRVLQAARGRGRGFTFGFLRRVGGMSFEGVAQPDAALVGKELTLSYNSKRPDGQRLVISVGKANYFTDIADWMLIPIAKYAESDFTALVSLTDREARLAGHKIVYHPALKDTLLGLRLFQGDALLIDPQDLRQFPKRGREDVLGEGESLPNETDSARAASEIESFMQQAKEVNSQSWIITDEGVDIRFSTGRSNFILTGDFYHYFWRVDPGEEYRKYEEQQTALLDKAEALESQGKWEEAEKLYDQADDMKRPEYSEAYKKYLEQRDILYAKAKALVSQGKWAEAEKLYDQAEDLDRPVVEVSSLTQGLKSKRSVLRQINPHLYDEINKTMRYAALFRYVKLNYPSSWKIFYAQLANKEPEPAVVTPYSFTARRN